MKSRDNPIRIGVIGCGTGFKKLHQPVIENLVKLNVYDSVVFCDLNLQAAQDASKVFKGSLATSNASDVINNKNIDAVLIFASAQVHYTLGKQALAAGKHLFTEKPPAPDQNSLLEMINLAKDQNMIAACGFNRRFYTGLTKALDIIGGNALISSIEAVFHKDNSGVAPRYGAKTWFGANAIHSLDYILSIMEPQRPKSIHTLKNAINASQDSNFTVLIEWPSGVQASLISNNSAGMRKEAYALHGVNQSCFYEGGHLNAVGHKNETYRFDNTPQNMGFEDEHLAFAQAIHENTQPKHSLKSAYASIKITDLVEQGYSGDLIWSELSDDVTDSSEGAQATLDTNPTAIERKTTKVKGKPGLILYKAASIQPYLEVLNQSFEIYHGEDLSSIPDKNTIRAVIQAKGSNAIPDDLPQMFPNIEIMGAVGASLRKFSADVFVSNNIPIVNASPIYAKSVAEFVLMQMLAARRHAVQGHDMMKRGGWLLSDPERNHIISKNRYVYFVKKVVFKLRRMLNQSLVNAGRVKIKTINDIGFSSATKPERGKGGKSFFYGSRIALIGYGPISQHLIKHLQAFECDIWVHSNHLSDEEAQEKNLKKVSIEQAMTAPIISLHRGLNEKTKGSITKALIDKIQPGAIFINTARAEIVDNHALVERLKKHDIYACLDVFDIEPLPPNNPFRTLPNVFLTPHIAGSIDAQYSAAIEYVIEQVTHYFSDQKTPDHMVNSLDRLNAMT